VPTQQSPSHVLTTDAVKWSIATLGSQRIDPAFIYYLYLRQQWVDGHLGSASPSSSVVKDLIRMPGGPVGKPYYRPLRERGQRTGELLRTFWVQPNLSGSWSTGSLARLTRAQWLVDQSGNYTMPENHAQKAKDGLLFGATVPALAMGAFFLRNDGFVLDGVPVPAAVVEGFKRKFRYREEDESDFALLFDNTTPSSAFEWFEPVTPAEALDE
jgi:hypothetical protein